MNNIENTECALKMNNIEKLATLGTQDKYKQKQNSNHCTKTNTNNVNKTWTLLHTTGDKNYN